MHCKQVWLLYVSELWLYSPYCSLACSQPASKAAAEAQSVLLLQHAHLASFGLLCSKTSVCWLLKQIVLHSMDLLPAVPHFLFYLVLASIFSISTLFFFLFLPSCQQRWDCWIGSSERAKTIIKYHFPSTAPFQHLVFPQAASLGRRSDCGSSCVSHSPHN